MDVDLQPLPIKVNIVCYFQDPDKNTSEILLLQRAEHDGGFWQTLTETVEYNESLLHAVERGLSEEAGIQKGDFEIEGEIYRFNWERKGVTYLEFCFSVRLNHKRISLSEEHQRYTFLSPKEAVEMVEYESNKVLLEKFMSFHTK
jgi:8-oxo-dGTP pyrophosphatase MutT (NUDIX family)